MTKIETAAEFASYFDSTILSPTATTEDIIQLCSDAMEYGFASVCVNSRWIPFAKRMLNGSGVNVCTVIGFPLGADLPESKAMQTQIAIQAGADEIDMVADLTSIIDGDADSLKCDIDSVFKVCREWDKPIVLKVIIEAAALTDEQIKFVCGIASDIGVDFVKTSTGFHKAGGATIEAVRLMGETALNCKVKAAGGIRSLEDALNMIEAGASRIGSSNAVGILEEFEKK